MCKHYTSHVTFSPTQCACWMMCDTTLAQVLLRVIPSMCHAPEWLFVLSSILTLHSSFVSPIFHFILLNFDFYLFLFHVDVFGARSPVHFAQWGVWPVGQQRLSNISNSDEVHRRYQNNTYVTLMYCWRNRMMITGTWMEKENCLMHGQTSQDSSYWTKGHLKDIQGPGRDWRENKTTSRPDNVWPGMWDAYVWCSEKQSKTKVGYLEIKACGKLEIPMPSSLPCKTPIHGSGETCRSIGKHKTKYACIAEADESMRIRLEGVQHRYHEDPVSAKGINSVSHYHLVHKFIPMP